MTLLNVAAWMERGCKPDDEHAPSIGQLQALERDDLLARIERFGGPPLWTLTGQGLYERDRLLAARYRTAEADAEFERGLDAEFGAS
ncbi:MAG TPA: hypothetical protein VF156_15565 [Agromyces sp.]